MKIYIDIELTEKELLQLTKLINAIEKMIQETRI